MYLFSDGYQHQFGGHENSKFSIPRFHTLLNDIKNLPFTEQKNILESKLSQWKGTNPQIDDILIIGLKI